MEWKIYKDADIFSEKVENLLYKHEDKYSLFLGILGQIKNGRYDEYYLGLAIEGEGVVAAALMTPPHPLQLIVFKENDGLATALAQHLQISNLEVPGVIGDKEVAAQFAQAWAKAVGVDVELHVDEGLYKIDSLALQLEKSKGGWRVANMQDAELLEEWYLLFEQDTGIGKSNQKEAAVKIEQFLKDKEVYVWEVGGEVVSCMKKSRPTKHGITVSFVFTPVKHRKKGYARTLVAEVTEELLLEFDFVMLYTDLKNPTSNKIYSEIGYVQIANPVYLRFV